MGGPKATYEALLGQLQEAEKFHDTEHIESIKKHWAHYLGRVEGTTPAWDYSDDEAQAQLEKAAFYHRHHITRENAYPEARREHNDMRDQRAATCHMPLSTANDLKHEAGCRSGFSYGQHGVQRVLVRHCVDGLGDDLRLADDLEREQEVQAGARHQRLGDGHRVLPLLPYLQLVVRLVRRVLRRRA